MATILLAACVVACPLTMGVMMLAMRRGTPQRKTRGKRPGTRGDEPGSD